MAAALAPRVRVLVVCDGVRPSRVEEGVYHLRGARSQVWADAFPLRRRLWLFVVLSSPRAGRFPCYVRVVNDQSDRAVYYAEVLPAPVFPGDSVLLPLDVPVNVRFPQAGRYTVEVWFFREAAADVLKMEQPFYVLAREA